MAYGLPEKARMRRRQTGQRLASWMLAIFATSSFSYAPLFSAASATGRPVEYEGFIRVQDGRFVDSNCQQFPVTGMNTYVSLAPAVSRFQFTLILVFPSSLHNERGAV